VGYAGERVLETEARLPAARTTLRSAEIF